jgi:hypothetical protein
MACGETVARYFQSSLCRPEVIVGQASGGAQELKSGTPVVLRVRLNSGAEILGYHTLNNREWQGRSGLFALT